jgi:streptogramin lyase
VAHVFISYAREDKAAAENVAAVLTAAGLPVWWDEEIPLGKSFEQVIEERLADASSVVVLWSTASIRSAWVRAEAREALERDLLFSVMLEDVRLPLLFREYQSANLVGWTSGPSSALDRLVNALQARREADEQARREADEQARREADEQARREADEQARREADEQARREADEQAQRDEQARRRTPRKPIIPRGPVRVRLFGLVLVVVAVVVVAVVAWPDPEPKPNGGSGTETPDPTREPVESIPVGEKPNGVAVGRFVWVANYDGTVTRIDPDTHEASEGIDLKIGTDLDSAAADDGSVWVTGERSGKVARIDDDRTSHVDRRITLEGDRQLKGVAVNGSLAWVADCYGTVIRIGPGKAEVPIPVPGHPRSVVVRGGSVYVGLRPDGADRNCDKESVHGSGAQKGSILVLDTTANPTAETLARVDDPTAVAVTRRWVWVADQDGDRVWRVDRKTKRRTSIEVERPDGLAADEDGVWALTRARGGEEGGTVTHIDPATREVLESIPVDGDPWEIAIGAGRVWVSQREAGTVAVITPVS